MPRFNPLAPPPKPKIKAALAAIRLPDGDIAITAVTAPQKSSVAAPAVVKPAHGGTITLTINNARELVELRFPGKPDDATRAEMKAAKFRWYGPAGCWYHKHTPENLAWAQAFLARHNAAPTTPTPAAPTNPPIPKSINPLPTITPPPAAPPAPVYIPPLPPLPGMTPLGLAPLKNVTSTTPPSSVPAWRKRLAR